MQVSRNSPAPPLDGYAERSSTSSFGGMVSARRMLTPVLPGSGDDRAHGGEYLRAGHGSKPTGDLHPQLHHADVALRLVIGERHIEIRGEPKHVGFAVAQAEQQIVPGPWRRPAAGAGRAPERR